MHLLNESLADPFQRDVLPELPVPTLAFLRATCRKLKRLVDEQTGPVWKSAASALLSDATLPTSPDGFAVQGRLRHQAAALTSLTSGQTT